MKNALWLRDDLVNGAGAATTTRRVYPRPVHYGDLTPVEQRVLGCLIEKRWTTPDQYPLSLNALRLACNQATNRDPVTDYAEPAVRDAAQRLSHYGLARLASGHNTRATKYRHLAEEGLGLDRDQLAVLCVLLLRGPQTLGELKARSERMAPLESLADVERVLAELGQRGYVARLQRRPGQKEDRFGQRLGGDGAIEASEAPEASEASVGAALPARARPPTARAPGGSDLPASQELRASSELRASGGAPGGAAGAADLEPRVAALEADLAALRVQLADLL